MELDGLGRFLRLAVGAAVVDCIVLRRAAQLTIAALAGKPVSRDLAGQAMTYLRAHYGGVDRAALGAVDRIWRAGSGSTPTAQTGRARASRQRPGELA